MPADGLRNVCGRARIAQVGGQRVLLITERSQVLARMGAGSVHTTMEGWVGRCGVGRGPCPGSSVERSPRSGISGRGCPHYRMSFLSWARDGSEGLWRNGSASDSRSEGWEFESLWPHLHHGREDSKMGKYDLANIQINRGRRGEEEEERGKGERRREGKGRMEGEERGKREGGEEEKIKRGRRGKEKEKESERGGGVLPGEAWNGASEKKS